MLSKELSSSPPKSASERIVVTICTYNERDNLGRLLTTIRETLPQADIMVVDDNSPDGTGDLADERAQADPAIHVLHRYNERGLGTATIHAFQQALERGYDILINLDADFSHDPKYFIDLLTALDDQQADVAIGSRYVESGGVQGWPLKRKFMSSAINAWSRFWLGLKTRDCSGSYRAYRCALLRKIDFSKFLSQGYSVQEELLYRCAQAGATFTEVPIVFVDREVGTSKINLSESMKAVWLIARCGCERGIK